MSTSLPSPGRRHDIDAIRVFAFGLLILYHVGMFYVADWGWHVKSAYLSEALQWPMMVVNRWRMPLLFLVSGLAVNFLLRDTGAGRFAWLRVKRLLLPLVFGMLVVVPPQAWQQALANGAFSGGYLAFLSHYFSFTPWPAGAFDGSHVGITWNHLWYLPYLLAYSLVLAALLPLLRSRAGLALRDGFRALRGWKLVVVPIIPLVPATWLLSGPFPSTHDLVSDWFNHAHYFTVFLYGWWIGRDPGLWAELRRMRWTLLAVAVLAFAAFAVLRATTVSEPSFARAMYDVAQRLTSWSWILLVLAWGHHWLNRPFRWLPWATESVYPWYILHQTLIVLCGVWLSGLALGPVLEPVLLVLLTAAGCVLLTEALVRPFGWVRPLFGLKPRAPARGGSVLAPPTGRSDHGPEFVVERSP